MDTIELVKRMDKAGCTFTQMLIISDLEPDQLNAILVNNIRTNNYKKASPSSMPNAFYIKRIKEGKTVQEIAEELGCNISGLYKVLRQRGISRYNYTKLKGENNE